MKQVLADEGDRIDHVFFPITSVVSLLARYPNGRTIEVGIVGREGMTGLPLALGVETSMHHCLVQVPGEALRVKAETFRTLAGPGTFLHAMTLRYAHTFLAQISLSVGCNSLHSIEKRLCRWLLMVQRRTASDRFPMTQKFLADMLGVRRASVSEATQKLQQQGLIRCGRGHIEVLDRPQLEAAACECFPANEASLNQLFS